MSGICKGLFCRAAWFAAYEVGRRARLQVLGNVSPGAGVGPQLQQVIEVIDTAEVWVLRNAEKLIEALIATHDVQ